MSPNANKNTNNNNTHSVVEEAREYLHGLTQTDEHKAMAQQGQKTAVDRALEKVTDPDAAEPVKPTPSKDKNALEEARDQIYQATMTPEEKKAHEDAQKTIPEKARDEAEQGPLGNVKDVVGSTLQGATDTIGNATNATKDAIGSTYQKTADGIGNAANATVAKMDDVAQNTTQTIGSILGGDKTKKEDPPETKTQASSNDKELPEQSYVDGMNKLGDQVAEKAQSTVDDLKAKFDQRLNEDSAGQPIDRKDSNKKD
jgi:hypothetical protein